jgi:phosphorylase/glycogen(starch) synthase
MPTWVAPRWRKLYENEFPEGFMNAQSDPDYWKAIYDVENRVIWDIKQAQRKDFIEYLKERISCEMTQRQENPSLISRIMESLNDKALIIGFARRFAAYKRAYLIFRNIDRLAEIVNIPDKPVIFVFAGKAHPADNAGKELIKKIIEITRKPQFVGKIIFIENYDIELAKRLIQSVDVWLNTPQRPMEASGTSGQKAVMNGVINFSVLDGWWAEGYLPGAGWAVKEEITYEKEELQDDLDAETIYNIFEEEIIPTFYDRNETDIPVKWIQFVKNTIANIAPRFTMKRMIDEYYSKIYEPMFHRSALICKDNFENARKIAAWKRKVLNGWDSIEVISVNVPESNSDSINLGDTFNAEVVIDLNELSDLDVCLEVIFVANNNGKGIKINLVEEMKVIKKEKHIITFGCNINIENAGIHDYAFRLYPKHELLPHRQDFPLIKWI